MKKFALLTITLFLFIIAKAQDRIISINHDTIHCTIVSINNERITYELRNKDGSMTGKTINLSQTSEYTRSKQSNAKVNTQNTLLSKFSKPSDNLWIMGLNIGLSTMPWYFDSSGGGVPEEYNKFKTGYHVNASAHYMLNYFCGAGVEYSYCNTSMSNDMQSQTYTSLYLTYSEKIRQYINYFGPSILVEQHPGASRKLTFSESLSAGLLFIRLENQTSSPTISNSIYYDNVNNSLITGNTFSAKLGLAAEYKVFRNVSVGLGGDFIWASLKKVSFTSKSSNSSNSSTQSQELNNAMNLSRFDLSIALRYKF